MSISGHGVITAGRVELARGDTTIHKETDLTTGVQSWQGWMVATLVNSSKIKPGMTTRISVEGYGGRVIVTNVGYESGTDSIEVWFVGNGELEGEGEEE